MASVVAYSEKLSRLYLQLGWRRPGVHHAHRNRAMKAAAVQQIGQVADSLVVDDCNELVVGVPAPV